MKKEFKEIFEGLFEALLAQLVEHSAVNRKVAGSNPV